MEKELTLKQKDKLAKKIYKSYQRAQLDILYLSQHYNYYPQIDIFKVKEGDTNYQKHDAMILQQMERKQELDNFVSMIKCQFIKVVRSDHGTEFNCLQGYFFKHEMLFESSCVGTP